MRAAALTFAAFTALAMPAWGQRRDPAVEAEQQRGVQLLQRHQNDEALSLFRALYERTREPRALWRMGTAEAALGRWVEAEGHMSAAFASSGDPWIRSEREALAQTLRQVQARVGLLVVRCNVPGASVEVGGAPVTSFPVRVPAGDVRVTVRASGHQEATASVTVPGDVEHPFVHTIELIPTAGVAAPVVGEAAGGVAAPIAPRVQPDEATSRPGAGMRAGGIVTLSLGVAGVATGVVGLVLRNAAAERFNANAACGELELPMQGGVACADDASAVSTMQTLGIAGLVAGGALSVTGVILLVAAPSGERARALVLGPGPGDVGVALGGRW